MNDKKLTTRQIVFLVIVGLFVLGLFAPKSPTPTYPTSTTSDWCATVSKVKYHEGDEALLARYIKECS